MRTILLLLLSTLALLLGFFTVLLLPLLFLVWLQSFIVATREPLADHDPYMRLEYGDELMAFVRVETKIDAFLTDLELKGASQ